MKRLHTRGGRFDSEDVNPMNYIANLSDAMLILAVGIMLALIVHWNVDISTSGGTMSDSGTTYAADGSVLVDKDNAAAMTQEELDKMQHDTSVGQDSQGMEKAGELYYDAATGTYYIVCGN